MKKEKHSNKFRPVLHFSGRFPFTSSKYPKTTVFSHQLPTLSRQSGVHKHFSFSLLCLPMWEAEGGKKRKKKKKRREVSDISVVNILSVDHSTWQSKTFILLYQCKPRGQSAHRLSPGGLADLNNWPVPQVEVSLTPWSYSPLSALLQSSQPWTDLWKSSWRSYFSHHSGSEHQRFQFTSRYQPMPPVPASILPGLKLLCQQSETPAVVPAEKQQGCESETLVSQGLLLQWRWTPLLSCPLIYIPPSYSLLSGFLTNPHHCIATLRALGNLAQDQPVSQLVPPIHTSPLFSPSSQLT